MKYANPTNTATATNFIEHIETRAAIIKINNNHDPIAPNLIAKVITLLRHC